MHSEANRAAKLVALVRDKMEQNPKYYHAFIEALKEDQSTHRHILKQLKTKYDSLSGGEKIIFICYSTMVRILIMNICLLSFFPTGSRKQTTTSPHSQVQVQAEAASTAAGTCITVADIINAPL